MHELAVTESILEIALRHARQHQASRIESLQITVGELSSIVDDSVQFYWDIISQGTEAEGAELQFERIPARLECQACQTGYSPREGSITCPTCGSANIQIVSGEEFQLTSIIIPGEPVA